MAKRLVRFWIFALLLLFVMPQARAESKLDVKGQFRLRTESRSVLDVTAPFTLTLLRAFTLITFTPRDNLFILVQPQFAKAFGEVTFSGSSAQANIRQPTSGAFFDTSLSIHQAYMSYGFSPEFRLIGGRQTLSYGDELLVGAGIGWQNIGRSFDAIRFRNTRENGAYSDLFFSKVVDGDTLRPTKTDIEFFGFYNSWNISKQLKEFDLYLFYYIDEQTAASQPTGEIWTAGIRAKSPLIENFDYRIEADYQFRTRDYLKGTAFQTEAELGYSFLSAPKSRLGVGAFLATQDFNQLFAAAHKWIGLADFFGRRNIMGAFVRASTQPFQKSSLVLDGYRVFRYSEDSPAYRLNGVTLLDNKRPMAGIDLGTEFDLTFKYETADALELVTGGSLLIPGDYLAQQFSDRPQFLAYVQMEVKF